jgi:predicted nucleic acid-binding protein
VRRRVVCDASALLALILARDADGRWVARALRGARISAPTLVRYETANAIRGHERAGRLTGEQATSAHEHLLALPIQQWPYGMLARRVWELRHNLTAYDASYVALAELLDATLLTLDAAIARTPGIRCSVDLPR